MVAKATLAILVALAVAAPPAALGTMGLGPFNFLPAPFGADGASGVRADVPTWTVGTRWVYGLKGMAHQPFERLMFRGDLTITVSSVVPASESGVGAELYRLDLEAPLQGRAFGVARLPAGEVAVREGFLAGSQWYRTDELSLVRESLDLSIKASKDGVNFTLTLRVTHSYDPALPVFAFPLEVGKAWDRTTTVGSKGTSVVAVEGPFGTYSSTQSWDITYNRTGSARVVSYDNVTTPAGSFAAFHIVANAGRLGDHGDDDGEEATDEEDGEQDDDSGDRRDSSGIPKGMTFARLRFHPASHLWYSDEVDNAVAFRTHLPMGFARVMLIGSLMEYRPA